MTRNLRDSSDLPAGKEAQGEKATPIGGAEGAAEQTVEHYMEALLQRLQGQVSSAAAPNMPKAPAINPRPAPRAPEIAPKAEAAAPLEGPAPAGPQTPRRQAPESANSLGAMRELATQNSRHAIQAHSTRGQIQQAQIYLVVAVVAIATGFGLLASSQFEHPWILAASLGAASYSSWKFWKTTTACTSAPAAQPK